MPHNGTNYEGRRRGICRNTHKANNQDLSTGLVSEAVVHRRCPAVTTGTCDSTPPCTPTHTNPPCMVNGHINHVKNGKNSEVGAPRTQRKTVSAASDCSAAASFRRAVSPDGVLVNGATCLDIVATTCKSNQMSQEHSPFTAAKGQRRWKKFTRKKSIISMPPQDKEDWENEIQDVAVTLPDCKKTSSGVTPFGPEDVILFVSTLKQTDPVPLPLSGSYRPAIHHPRPLTWSHYSAPPEPDQFADADE